MTNPSPAHEYREVSLNKRGLSPMSPKQYAAAIKALGLSQVKAGKFLGVTARQSRRYIAGDASVPEGFAKFLRLMVRLNLRPEDVP